MLLLKDFGITSNLVRNRIRNNIVNVVETLWTNITTFTDEELKLEILPHVHKEHICFILISVNKTKTRKKSNFRETKNKFRF